jgi:plastocyanin
MITDHTAVNEQAAVLAKNVTAPGAGVESGAIAPGASWRLVARRPGEMPYVCRFHPMMKAVVLVK